MTEKDKIEKLRQDIDAIDKDLLNLISARAKCAVQIATAKRATKSPQQSFYRPNREADILRRLCELNQGPLSNAEIERLFQEIMSACLALEQTMKIGFLGPAATFTHQAALKQFGHSVQTTSLNSIEEVFQHTAQGHVAYGVVPIENSTEGVVTHTLDQFMFSAVKIVGEVQMYVHHHLLSVHTRLEEIQTIYSHPQSFAQCRRWLNQYAAHCKQLPVNSTAAAAQQANDEANSAAICSENVLSFCNKLAVLHKNIEDEPDNRTRFLIIGRNIMKASSDDKTSLLISTNNRPGALLEVLKPFAEHGVSLMRIESRPARTEGWDYVFFIDAQGHIDNEPLSTVIQQLKKQCLVKILGSYPHSVLHDPATT